MEKLFIRHGLSEANNRENWGKLAFASAEAPLMELGREQARALGPILSSPPYGLDIANTPAASSEMLRAQETAHGAGFTIVRHYPVLNEVDHWTEMTELRAMLDRGELPARAYDAADAVLENPPLENVVFTHGLVIAALTRRLGAEHNYERLIPRFCEIRKFTFPQH
jgi:broad specificity phosphatase PhoE